MRLRVLPLVMAGAAALLTFRAVELWNDAGTAFAQAPARDGKPAAPAPEPTSTLGSPTTAAPAAPRPSEPVSVPEFSEAELAVLQDLVSRREALDQRSSDLDRREALLKAAEQRIEAKVKELKQLQTAMEGVIRQYDEQEEARKKSLVRIFESMKPAEAARIFEQMDLPVLLDVIERMKERSAAPVLAQMHPVRAKQVTAELARRRQPVEAPNAPPNG